MAWENCLRKPQTASGFVPEACKTQPLNTLGTSPLESIKNMSLTTHGLGKPPAKVSNSSRIRARSMQNTTLKHSRNVTFPQPWNTLGTSTLESIKNMSLTTHGLGKPPAKASNSSKIRARSMQNTSLKNSRNVTFGIHKKHVSHGTWPWKTAAESLEQQQDSCSKHAKHKPEKLSERHLWNL